MWLNQEIRRGRLVHTGPRKQSPWRCCPESLRQGDGERWRLRPLGQPHESLRSIVLVRNAWGLKMGVAACTEDCSRFRPSHSVDASSLCATFAAAATFGCPPYVSRWAAYSRGSPGIARTTRRSGRGVPCPVRIHHGFARNPWRRLENPPLFRRLPVPR
jgi:hypothetical protein